MISQGGKGSPHEWTLTFDGGATPNPGIASCAFKAVSGTDKVLRNSWKMKGMRTNNEAEWDAVVTGLEAIVANDKDTKLIKVIGDSELVINQLSGTYKVRNYKLRPFFSRFNRLKKPDLRMSFYHVHREFNEEMDIACKSARG